MPALLRYAAFITCALAAIGLAIGGLVSVGCSSSPGTSGGTGTAEAPSDEELKKLLDQAIDLTYLNRALNTEEQAAWQILHGVLAFGKEFRIQPGKGNPYERAADYALAGKPINGWKLRPGDVLDEATGRVGVVAELDLGSKKGQGHIDQWLGYMSGCDYPLDTPIMVGGKQFTLADWLAQSERDISRNEYKEYSWTLMCLANYRPTDYTWTAVDGETWSLDRIIKWEAEQDLRTSACGGTHRMVGVVVAYNKRLAEKGEMTGGWEVARKRIQECIALAKQFQNPDGSFSANYFSGPGNKPDLADTIGTSGHTLEFLALSLSDEQLREPWMKRGVANLCTMLIKTKNMPLECGALFHGAHGLVLYRERMFGKRALPPWPESASSGTPAVATGAGG